MNERKRVGKKSLRMTVRMIFADVSRHRSDVLVLL